MKKIYYFAALAAVAGAMTSCSNEAELASNDVPETATLGINVGMAGETNGVLSRSLPDDARTGTAFSNGDKIGITVLTSQFTSSSTNDQAKIVSSGDNSNVYNTNKQGLNLTSTVTTDGTQSTTTWSAPGLNLNSTNGYVYAYYPVLESTPSAETIDITNGNDWMYGSDATAVNAARSTAAITMHHALAKIIVTLTEASESDYTGTGSITNVTLTANGTGDNNSDKAFCTSGTLNYLNGKVAIATEGTPTYSVGSSETLSDKTLSVTATGEATDPIINQWMVVPGQVSGSSIKVNATVDGVTYNTTYTAQIDPGKKYTLNLKLKDTALAIGSVTITDWTDGSTASGDGALSAGSGE